MQNGAKLTKDLNKHEIIQKTNPYETAHKRNGPKCKSFIFQQQSFRQYYMLDRTSA